MEYILRTFYKEEAVYLENNFDQISSPQKQLVAVHGLGTYGGWFHGLAAQLVEKQIVSYLFDLPGFGKSGSGNYRGRVSSYRLWLYAVQEVWQYAQQRAAESTDSARSLPTFLLGHSLGGAIALAALPYLRPRPAGVIISVPSLLAHPQTYPFFRFVLPTLRKAWQNPSEKIIVPYPPELKQAVIEERIPISQLTSELEARTFWEIVRVNLVAWSTIWRLKNIPLFFLLAGQDETCSSSASKIFFDFCNSEHKKLITYPDFGHDLFVIPESDRINSEICDWIGRTG